MISQTAQRNVNAQYFSAFNRRTLFVVIIVINCIKRIAEVQHFLGIIFQNKLQNQKETV